MATGLNTEAIVRVAAHEVWRGVRMRGSGYTLSAEWYPNEACSYIFNLFFSPKLEV